MALVKGPLFSLEAAGSVGRAIVFSKWKGRAYVRQHVVPSNPMSGAQVGRRSMFGFLAQMWAGLSAPDQAAWQTVADQIVCSPFNAYIKINMEFWHQFLTPSQNGNFAGVSAGSDNVLTAAAWEENRIKLSIAGTALAENWGIIIFGKLGAAVTPTVGTAVMVKYDGTIAAHVEYFTPPETPPGTQLTFDTITFSDDGDQEVAGGPQST